MHRLRSTSPPDDRDRNYALLCPEDRKEPVATHPARGTWALRPICCLSGGTSQPHASRPGRSTVQFERKTAGTSPFNTLPLRQGGQARDRGSRSESRDSGGNDWYNPLTSEFLHEQIQRAWLHPLQRRTAGE